MTAASETPRASSTTSEMVEHIGRLGSDGAALALADAAMTVSTASSPNFLARHGWARPPRACAV